MSLERMDENKGITLIALVVTIVILIILATLSISVTFGEGGLIAKARQAKKDAEGATVSEQEKLAEVEQGCANILASNGSGEVGNIDPETGWDLDKVKKVTSEDDVVVPVPIGYTASTVTGEKRVDTGLVIKEGSNGAATSSINEFVWVPVENIEDLYDAKNDAGQLWEFSGRTSSKKAYPTTQNSGYREPDVVTNASSGSDSTSGGEDDEVPTNLTQAGFTSDLNKDEEVDAKDFKIQLQNEFKAMKDSVEKYGGFYIGRYETGDLSEDTAVVQKNNSDIGGQTWYTHYKLSKRIATDSNVTSSIIWGCQWDATLRWFQTSSNSGVANFPTNSEGKGNYYEVKKEDIIPTGSKSAYAVNNIYDMGGNLSDWTMETGNANSRTVRGGWWNNTSAAYPPKTRATSQPTRGLMTCCSRSTLFVTV